MTEAEPRRASPLLPLLLIAAVLAAALVVPRLLRGDATLPAAFRETSLDAAIQKGKLEEKPVLVLVTSDTCGACDRLKRSTLSDRDVATYLADAYVPVSVNESTSPGDARRLPYRYLPTTLVIDDGTVVARLEGFRPADDYLEWLRWGANAADPATASTTAP